MSQEELLRQISDCSLSALEDPDMTLATLKKILLSIATVSQAQTFWSERYCLQVQREVGTNRIRSSCFQLSVMRNIEIFHLAISPKTG